MRHINRALAGEPAEFIIAEISLRGQTTICEDVVAVRGDRAGETVFQSR
jgi:hypothetical protein